MSSPVYPRTLADELALIRQLAQAALTSAKRRAPLAAIAGLVRVVGGGTIAFENPAGAPVATIGAIGDGRTGARFANRDGVDVVAVYDDGLDRPYLPVPFYRAPTATWVSVTSATPVAEFAAEIRRQHTSVTVDAFMTVDAATTASMDLYDSDNAAVLATVDIQGPFNGHTALNGLVSGQHMDPRLISVRFARTVGAGNVLVQLRSAYTLPAPPA